MEYEIWWPLHARSVRGETLTPAESATLSAAYDEQDAAESEALRPGKLDDLNVIRELRESSRSLQAAIATNQKQRRRITAQIRRLAGALDSETRTAIGLPPGP
jgi:hypothetical protein